MTRQKLPPIWQQAIVAPIFFSFAALGMPAGWNDPAWTIFTVILVSIIAIVGINLLDRRNGGRP